MSLRRRTASASAVVVVAVAGMLVGRNIAPASADTCVRHSFNIATRHTSGSYQPRWPWSAYGDLYAGDGTKVYHWQETTNQWDHSLSWGFNYCGDNGWASIWIDIDSSDTAALRYQYLNLRLDGDHRWCLDWPQDPNGPYTIAQC